MEKFKILRKNSTIGEIMQNLITKESKIYINLKKSKF